jgi:hypothetical protein
MLNLETRIDKDGFWYLIDTRQDVYFCLQYFVIGTQAKFSSGEIKGNTLNSGGWQFCKINFPILHLGVTDLTIDEVTDLDKRAEIKMEEPVPGVISQGGISRRKMINQTVSALLVGGAVLPSLLSVTGNVETTQTTTPYVPHSPYNNPYGKKPPPTPVVT